jgi:light-regulated signal transduction histidine kinase (bacteriophytochrome)
LLKKYKGILDEKAQSYLNQIMECSIRAKSLVEDLRELSKSGELSLEFEEVSSKEIVENVKTVFHEMIDNHRLQIEVVGELPVIVCDKKAIYRVFENLTGNAVKYMGEKDDARIEIGYEDKGDFHKFYLKDNGVGIDPKDQAKIFRKFHRLKEAKEKKGTGLGLAIVKRIIESHRGRIWVESEKGEGATFFFTLAKNPDNL